MNTQIDKNHKLLIHLGYDYETAQIFNYLLKNGVSTVLQISKGTNLSRMNIYRKCEILNNDGLIAKLSEYKTTKYEISSLHALSEKIAKVENKIKTIKNEYSQIESIYKNNTEYANQKIKVIHYTGAEQIKQLIWNSLSAKTEILSFGYRTLAEITGKQFVANWWDEMVSRKIENRIILNDHGPTVKDKVEKKETKEKYIHVENQKIWQPRIISSQVIHITQETFVYDNVYALIQWDENNIFGVEIYNKTVVDMERQIFEQIWQISKPIKA